MCDPTEPPGRRRPDGSLLPSTCWPENGPWRDDSRTEQRANGRSDDWVALRILLVEMAFAVVILAVGFGLAWLIVALSAV